MWASMRLQTLYRTIQGMMKHRTALRILLSDLLPHATSEQVDALTDAKYRCVAALQRYDVMTPVELEHVEVLLELFPTLSIAYIKEVQVQDAQGDRHPTFYSCLVDGKCPPDPFNEGKRLPRHQVELPGHPILGNGKSDNQNHALIFTRGAVVQTIDANQDGYIEESLKICAGLSEFNVRDRGATRGPAIVGFGEHIFSGLGSVGGFAANAELVFGTLVQHTMASPLRSRYHYGHPDMLDKTAMMAQGGVSKATKGLNLSEDIFAGMDAMLRGHNIVHREYMKVGKGRDMGFLSILAFFCKLSSGTAQMCTSRQAYRLGQRLGLARLFSFYYAHVGYYLGQLHFFHAQWASLAIAFIGAIADAVGCVPGAFPLAAIPVNQLYGPMLVLFLSSSIVPHFALVVTEDGLFKAISGTGIQLLRGSSLFFVFQSKCIGHYYAGEFAQGGATYIPTGRSLAIEHQPFHSLYASFAAPCLYPGLDVVIFIVAMWGSLRGEMAVGPVPLFFSVLYSICLLYSPSIFNPRAVNLKLARQDFFLWLRWLVSRDPKTSWSAFHASRLSAKAGAAAFSVVLPSKELLISIPLLFMIRQAMRPHNWLPLYTLVLAVPVSPAAAVALPLLVRRLLVARRFWRLSSDSRLGRFAVYIGCEQNFRAFVLLPAVIAALVAEPVLLCWLNQGGGIEHCHWILLITTRYFTWRWQMNGLAYLPFGH